METTDFEFETNRLQEMAEQAAWKMDNQLHVKFYAHAEKDAHASKEAGRTIAVDHVYVRIMAAANRQNVIERRATDTDKERFAVQYAQFLKGAEQLAIGSPISDLPSITKAQVIEMKALNIETVEQLAGVADSTLQILGTGGQELKQRAQRYLARFQSLEALSATNRALLDELIMHRKKAAEEAAAAAAGAQKVIVTEAKTATKVA